MSTIQHKPSRGVLEIQGIEPDEYGGYSAFDAHELCDHPGRFGGKAGYVILKMGVTYFGPKWERAKVFMKRGMYGRNGQIFEVGKLLRTGVSDRAIERATGVHRNTIGRLRLILRLDIGEPFHCKCGKPGNHIGWCRFRLTNKRKKFLREWNDPERRKLLRARKAKLNPILIKL